MVTVRRNKKTIYLDFASSTPIDPKVLRVLTQVSQSTFANPSALHKLAVEAHTILNTSRKRIAEAIGAHSDEIIFVSGGTESDNLALLGVIQSVKKKYPDIIPHVIVSAIEHAAVKVVAEKLIEWGVAVTVIPVDTNGLVDPKNIRSAIRPETVFVSIMYANNEIGTIEPIVEIMKEVRHARRHKDTHAVLPQTYPLMHTDASQALNYINIQVEKLGVDLLSFNSSKLYGPKGVGALFVKRNTPIEPLFWGGDQEFGLRPGTEPVPAIVAFAEAIIQTTVLRDKEIKRLTLLRNCFISELQKIFPKIRINGDIVHRLPNNINVTFPNINSELLVIYLDAEGICVSAKSACKSKDPEASHVIAALGLGDSTSETGSIRFSLGRGTTWQELSYTIKALKKIFTLLHVS